MAVVRPGEMPRVHASVDDHDHNEKEDAAQTLMLALR